MSSKEITKKMDGFKLFEVLATLGYLEAAGKLTYVMSSKDPLSSCWMLKEGGAP